MRHFASREFWKLFSELPPGIRSLAREKYELLKSNPRHPSLRFRKIGLYWSVRVDLRYRALGTDVPGGILWGWIGPHAEYDKRIG